PVHLAELRNRLHAALDAPDPSELHALLGELYLAINGLKSNVQHAGLPAVLKLCSALEGLIKKLVEQPALSSPSTTNAAAAALQLLEELCRDGCDPDLGSPPVSLLVVDDDPIARRAVSGALQLTFGRPENAESGEAAL